MERPFSEAMLKSIESQIEHCHEDRGILDVYRAAETVRRENLPDNVAHEDIVKHFVSNVGTRCTIEFLPESAKAIVRSVSRATPLKRRPLTEMPNEEIAAMQSLASSSPGNMADKFMYAVALEPLDWTTLSVATIPIGRGGMLKVALKAAKVGVNLFTLVGKIFVNKASAIGTNSRVKCFSSGCPSPAFGNLMSMALGNSPYCTRAIAFWAGGLLVQLIRKAE